MNLFDLYARIFLDTGDYEDKTKQITKDAGGLGGKIGKAFGTATKIIGAGVAVAATGVAALTKNAVDNFAEYEQLVGGAELMFGDAYDYVSEKAKNAYATVQMSQNEYLQQVNGFATGLKTALGGNEKAAADLADRILTAEADVVAATGNTQDAVQNAFNGIMKSNFTMLDNLQLGIKPTKEGFQELIDKVNDWNATNGKATHYQIGNLADMQSALVDYIEMQGLAGYAANEAMDTITGSATATKAAWQNLVTGLADNNADLGALIDSVVQSAGAMFKNIIPVATRALQGIGQAIKSIAPIIARELPGLVRDVLPPLLSAATDIVNALAESLPAIAQVLVDMAPSIINSIIDTAIGLLPQIIDLGMQLILALASGLSENLPTLIPSVIDMILQIQETLIDNLDMLVDAAIDLVMALADGLIRGIPRLVKKVPELVNKIVTTISKNAPKLLTAAVDIITQLVDGLLDNLPLIIDSALQIIDKLVSMLSDPTTLSTLINAAFQIISQLATSLIESLPTLIPAIIEIIMHIVDTLSENLDLLVGAAVDIILQLVDGLISNVDLLVDSAIAIIIALAEGLIVAVPRLLEKAPEIVSKLVEAIIENAPKLLTSAWELVQTLASGIAENFSTILQKGRELVSQITDGIKQKFLSLTTKGREIIDEVKKGIKEKIDAAKQWGKDLIQNFIDGITAKWKALKEKVSSVAQTVKSFLGFSVPETGPLSDADTYMPDFMDLMASGIKKYQGKVFDAAETLAEGIETHASPDFSIRGVSNYSTGNDSRILAALGIYFPELIDVIRNMKLYLDGKTLVGGIIDDTDTALGIRSIYAGRANY